MDVEKLNPQSKLPLYQQLYELLEAKITHPASGSRGT